MAKKSQNSLTQKLIKSHCLKHSIEICHRISGNFLPAIFQTYSVKINILRFYRTKSFENASTPDTHRPGQISSIYWIFTVKIKIKDILMLQNMREKYLRKRYKVDNEIRNNNVRRERESERLSCRHNRKERKKEKESDKIQRFWMTLSNTIWESW